MRGRLGRWAGWGKENLGKRGGGGGREEYQLFDLAVADHDGPNLTFRPRDQYWHELGVAAAAADQGL